MLPTGSAAAIVGGPVSADGLSWWQVDGAAGSGWVDGEYLTTAAAYAASPPHAIGGAMVVDTDVLNLRDSASIAGSIVAELVSGDGATIVDGAVTADGHAWYLVDTAVGSGWVDGEFLAPATTATPAASTVSTAFAIGDAATVATDALNLRDDATIGGNVVATLDTGAAATSLDGPLTVDGYAWWQVSTDAGTGWVDGEYLAGV